MNLLRTGSFIGKVPADCSVCGGCVANSFRGYGSGCVVRQKLPLVSQESS